MGARVHRRTLAKSYTLSEACQILNRSADELRTAIRKGFLSVYQPRHWVENGWQPHIAACEVQRFAMSIGRVVGGK